MKLWPPSRLRELYEEFSPLQVAPEEGATITFHTYHGFLVFFVQTEHRFCLLPDDARHLLWQFHKFNLTWGLLSYGAIFVPLLSTANYYAVKRSIRAQERTSSRRDEKQRPASEQKTP